MKLDSVSGSGVAGSRSVFLPHGSVTALCSGDEDIHSSICHLMINMSIYIYIKCIYVYILYIYI